MVADMVISAVVLLTVISVIMHALLLLLPSFCAYNFTPEQIYCIVLT